MELGRTRWGLEVIRAYVGATGRDIGVVGSDTEVVIEGYPRSGNTYALAAFRLAQGRPVRVGHHVHGSAQVLGSVERDIPCIVLVRRPVEAVASLLIRVQGVVPGAAFASYAQFYEDVVVVRDRVVVSEFSETISDFGEVVARLNERYGVAFRTPEPSEEFKSRVYAEIDRLDKRDQRRSDVSEMAVARPVTWREVARKQLEEKLDSPALAAVRRRAEAAFDGMLRGT
jgi:hypothetical protein